MRFRLNIRVLFVMMDDIEKGYRIVKKFLWLPLRLQDEIRWLEWVKIRQKYVEVNDNSLGQCRIGWHNIGWLD